jgi:ATPase subunit of ABC transporter with duplicated ATPase domains
MEKAATRMRDWASRADNEAMFVRAKAMERRIERMDLVDQPTKDKINFSIRFDGDSRSGKEVIRAENFKLKISDQVLAEAIEFTLIYGERAALIGNNGTGKSTLIKEVLRANEETVEGLTLSPSAKIGYLEQDIAFESDSLTILEAFKSYIPGLDGEIRSYLARFEFRREDVFLPVSNLSGGEKVRLRLAILMQQDINFLVLDEPTNHIDIKTRKVLEEALETFEGTILFVSHDRYFLNQFSDRIMVIDNKELKSYFGNYEYYKEKRKLIEAKVDEPTEGKVQVKKEQSKERKRKINPYKVEIFEKEIQALEARIDEKQSFIKKNPSAYVKIKTAVDEIKTLEVELEKILEDYYGYLELFESNNG